MPDTKRDERPWHEQMVLPKEDQHVEFVIAIKRTRLIGRFCYGAFKTDDGYGFSPHEVVRWRPIVPAEPAKPELPEFVMEKIHTWTHAPDNYQYIGAKTLAELFDPSRSPRLVVQTRQQAEAMADLITIATSIRCSGVVPRHVVDDLKAALAELRAANEEAAR